MTLILVQGLHLHFENCWIKGPVLKPFRENVREARVRRRGVT